MGRAVLKKPNLLGILPKNVPLVLCACTSSIKKLYHN